MKIKTRKKRNIVIAESGALSDIAFLLIIFFIVIAVFNINSGFILGLSKKNSIRIVNTQDIIKIDLQANGTILINKNPVTIPVMEENISANLQHHPNMTVLLKVHPEVLYQSVVSIIEIVRKLEVDNFSFAMTEGETL